MYRTFDLLLLFKTLFPFLMQINYNLNTNLELNEINVFLSRLLPYFHTNHSKNHFVVQVMDINLS